ncbi:MAG: TolC family protein [Bacteroidales bacterium]|nr:TolC family protein [Bacteroidales bacterium]
MKKSFAIIVLLAAFTASYAQTPAQGEALAPAAGSPWTLGDCIAYALSHNLRVQQSALQVEQKEIDLNTAKSSRLPGVSAGASQNFSFGRGLTEDNTYAHTNTSNTSLSLGADLSLFNGLRGYYNVEIGKLNLEAATVDLEKARDDIRVEVARQFVQILYDREIAQVAQRQVEIDAQQVERLEARAEIGKATAAEVAAQKASLAQSRLTAVQAGNTLRLALLDLSQTLELPSPEGFDVAVPHQGLEPLLLPASPEQVYDEAVGVKPSVHAEELRLALAGRNIDLAYSGYMPSLSLSGGIGSNYYGRGAMGFVDQLSNNFSQYVGLSLNIPIFSRFANRNQVKTARINYSNQQLQLETVKKQLFKEIQQCWYNAVAAREKFDSSSEAERAAAESFSLATAKYENGKATITEFNEAKNQYLKACSDLAQARYEYLFQTRLIDFYRGHDIEL